MKWGWEGEAARQALAAMQANLRRLERRVRVLIIDDSADDCALLMGEIMEAVSAPTIDCAHNQEEAERLCAAGLYDVIFLDLLFPKDSGVEILRHSPCVAQGTPVILVTGLEDDSVLVKEAMQAGAKVIFTKPITQDQLTLVFGRIP